MAKRSKPVSSKTKKAIPKKAAAKPAPSKAKKAVTKKPVKKAAPKKIAIAIGTKKPVAAKGKKIAVKKSAPKKVAAKKPAIKKVVAKKPATKKVVAKKPIAKKVIAVKRSKLVKPVAVKVAVKPALLAATKPVVKKQPAQVAAPIQLPDAIVENAANISHPMMVPGDGLDEAVAATPDPVKTFDKNVFNKATAKGDPHSNRNLSSKPKNAIKPSGKKPLW